MNNQTINNHFRIATINVASLLTNLNEIPLLFSKYNIDMLLVNELKINKSKLVQIKNFLKKHLLSSYFNVNDSSINNGVGIIFKSKLVNLIQTTKYDDQQRVIIIKIKTYNNKFLYLVNVYGVSGNQNNYDKKTEHQKLYKFLNSILQKYTNTVNSNEYLILGGDFNVIQEQTDCTSNRKICEEMKNLKNKFDLVDCYKFFNPLKNEKTFYKNSIATSRIDFFLSNNNTINIIKNCVIEKEFPTYAADHKMVMLTIENVFDENNNINNFHAPEKVYKIVKNNSTVEKFQNIMDNILSKTNTNDIDLLNDTILSAIEFAASKTWKKIDKPIFIFKTSDKITKLKDEKKGLLKIKSDIMNYKLETSTRLSAKVEQNCKSYNITLTTTKDTIINEINNKIQNIKQNITNEIRNWYKENNTKFINYLIQQEKTNPKTFFNCIKSRTHVQYDSYINDDDEICHNSELVMEKAKNYFEQLFKSKTNITTSNYQTNNNNNISITEDDIVNKIKKLKHRKSPGPDNINYELFKCCSDLGIKLITKLFNLCIKNNNIPKQWKDGTIVMVFKEGNKFMPENYRPITLLNCIYKIFTNIIKDKMMKIIISNGIIGNYQAGFMPNTNANNNIKTLVNIIESCNASKKEIHVLKLDIAKAFDSVEHELIYNALNYFNFPIQIINIIKSIYMDCTVSIRTVLGFSKKFKTSRGVRQGDPLSTCLFILVLEYVIRNAKLTHYGLNFTTEHNCFNLLAFADDILLISNNFETLEKNATSLINELNANGLIVNYNKSTYTCNFSRNQELKINDKTFNTIGYNDPFNYLGIKVKINATWHEHLTEIKSKTTLLINKLISKPISIAQYNKCIKVMLIPMLTYKTENVKTTQTFLNEIDKIVCSGAKNIAKLPRTCSTDFIFADKNKGGLGIVKPSNVIGVNQILSLYNALISNDHHSVTTIVNEKEMRPKTSKSKFLFQDITLEVIKKFNYKKTMYSSILYNLFKLNLEIKPKNFGIFHITDKTVPIKQQNTEVVFTDGAKIEGKAAYCVATANKVIEALRTPGLQCSYRSELFAIYRSLTNESWKPKIIYTDSLSSIYAINKFKNIDSIIKRSKMKEGSLLSLITKSIGNSEIKYIPAHSNIAGNELADIGAKLACKTESVWKIEPPCETYFLSQNGFPIQKPIRKSLLEIFNCYQDELWYKCNSNKVKISTSNVKSNFDISSLNKYDYGFKRFLIQIRSNTLPTTHRINYYQIDCSNCKLCNKEPETLEHFLLFCEHEELSNSRLKLAKEIQDKITKLIQKESMKINVPLLPYKLNKTNNKLILTKYNKNEFNEVEIANKIANYTGLVLDTDIEYYVQLGINKKEIQKLLGSWISKATEQIHKLWLTTRSIINNKTTKQ